jgi:hypothetical protein
VSAIEVERGVGQCPDRPTGFGHIWAGVIASGDDRNPCRFCGYPGRGDVRKGESGFFHEWGAARCDSLVGVHLPHDPGTGKPRDLTPEQMMRAEAIVADKKRRDAEAVANGTARPGQIAGAKGKR